MYTYIGKLDLQVAGGMFNWNSLNTLCWGIGSIYMYYICMYIYICIYIYNISIFIYIYIYIYIDINDIRIYMYTYIGKLDLQVAGGMFNWNSLNTLCWAIGSISGAMGEMDEKRYMCLFMY
jgi:hypothetical protein